MPLPHFVPGERYHLYSHANGFEKLYYEPENYRYFLRLLRDRLEPSLEMLAYCLLTNHFHLVVEVRAADVLETAIKGWRRRKTGEPFHFPDRVPAADRYHYFVHRQFTNILGGYTQAINKRFGRRGSLFQQNTKGKHIDSGRYLRSVLRYVHLNAVHHNIVADPVDYPYSSFLGFLGDADVLTIPQQRIIDWFGGREAFFAAHKPRRQRVFVRDLEPNLGRILPGTRIYEGEQFLGITPL